MSDGSSSTVMVFAKIGATLQVVADLFEIMMEDGLKVSLERLESAMPYMLKCVAYT
ncbi:hypothetical protein A2U01_0072196 [Trifolium medium]|uniref:Uncharacterized protein n=1 Tax=Trifolium medium TaxID=97028 RepID=A0A392SRA8_9FABA|nr:hypothetical protein [Trifolium medium]